jgi:tetratricopeptide (TPR) repeat protein
MPVEAPATVEATCERCGRPVPPGTYWCPSCGKLNASRRVRGIFVLILISILAGFFVTSRYVSYLKKVSASLAARWFARGQEAIARGYPSVAIEDYRNALGYEGDNPQYRLKLAEALMADRRLAEAHSYLLGLWSQTPGNAEVNLDLARLYAKENKSDQAVRYYRSAIDGVWSENALQRRIETRFELVHYLLQCGDRARAIAELIALQAETPDDPSLQLSIGNLLLQLGESSRAERTFESILKQQPQNADAWLGAGQAALAAGDYRAAVNALSKALALSGAKPGSPQDAQLALAREAFDADPSLRTLTLAERSKRVADAFVFAMDRLATCAATQGIPLNPPAGQIKPRTAAPPLPTKQNGFQSTVAPTAPALNSLQLLYDSGVQRRPGATAGALHKNPDAMLPTMEFVFQAVRATDAACPPETIRQRAFELLAQHEPQELR